MRSKQKVHEIYPRFKGKSLKYWQQLQSRLDAHLTRAQSLEIRKRMMDKQAKMNYQQEHDRLRNALEQTVLRRNPIAGLRIRGPMIADDEDRASIARRIEELRAKGAK